MQNRIVNRRKAHAPQGKHGTRGNATHQIRIIGGQWKRTPIHVPDAEGLRPTPDRVRETVFNWLNHLLDGQWQDARCLDLFAGSGALGLEAASRGAASVTLVENNPTAIAQLSMLKQKLGASQVDIVCGDALATGQELIRRQLPEAQRFQLIFLDPPFHQDWLPKILPMCAQLLAKDGLIYVEAEYGLEVDPQPPWLENWQVIRADKAGMVFYHILKSNKSA
ncbi:MAG: 16S rRNA (guanine(966)-N(2))-methyltransferase RsmD [Burkholderiaceae bacterium]